VTFPCHRRTQIGDAGAKALLAAATASSSLNALNLR
jgi:hypothetical protein